MIKYFCDICGKETNDSTRVKENIILNKSKTINIEIITGVDGGWNSGNFHQKCITSLIGTLYKK